MSDAHALLQAVWDTGEQTPLLALADLLDERGDHDAAGLIRLTVADATTARQSADRTRRLKQLRDNAWKRARTAPWPDMAVQPDTSASGFSRRPDPSSPTRETIVVRPERRIVHWLRVDLDGSDEVIRSGAGLELLRRELPPATLEFVRRGSDTRLHTSRRGADATAPWDVTMIGPDDISPGFRALLDRAGWHPGRRVGTDEWVSRLRAEGFTVNASAIAVLETFGGLSVRLPAAGISPYDHELQFEPVLAATGDRDRTEEWEAALGIRLFPLGQEVRTGSVVWAGDDGRLYIGREFGLYLLGETFRAAMDQLAVPATPLVQIAE
jgi:uncharacterized protein (TIGR02996 family)